MSRREGNAISCEILMVGARKESNPWEVFRPKNARLAINAPGCSRQDILRSSSRSVANT